MMFRALLLSLFAAKSLALGLPLQSPEGVPVEQETAGGTITTTCYLGLIDPNNPNNQQLLDDCGLENYVASDPLALLEITEPNDQLPEKRNLSRSEEFSEGVDEMDSQIVAYGSNDERIAQVLSNNDLRIFSRYRNQITTYTFDFANERLQISNPLTELSPTATSFALVRSMVEVGIDDGGAPVYGPIEVAYVAKTQDRVSYWSPRTGVWLGDQLTTLPENMDGFIAATSHPEIDYENPLNSGFVVSYKGMFESGLWMNGSQWNGSGFVAVERDVSDIDISLSKLIETHHGLTQFYIEDTEDNEVKAAHLRFIEVSGEPVITIKATDDFVDIDSVYSSAGTLYIARFTNGIDFIWHDKETESFVYMGAPSFEKELLQGGIQTVQMDEYYNCSTAADKIHCGFTGEDDIVIFEILSGQFSEKAVLDHNLLDQGIVSLNGVYEYGENLFISVQTEDFYARLFNATVAGTFHVKKSEDRNPTDVSIIPSFEAGMFYWVLDTGSGTNAFRVKANLNLDAENTENESSGRVDQEEQGAGDDEEGEEEPLVRKELSSSNNLFFLSIALLILLSQRKRIYSRGL